MKRPKNTLTTAYSLAALLLLAGCGRAGEQILLFVLANGKAAPGHLAVATASFAPTEADVDARERAFELAGILASERPDVLALRDAVTRRADGHIVHDDVELLLDELWRRDVAYEIASEVVVFEDEELTLRHLVLAGAEGVVAIVGGDAGLYASGDDGWTAAVLEASGTAIRVVATGLDRPHARADADELLDVLAVASTRSVVACGLTIADDVVDTLRNAGYALSFESDDGLLLERDVDAPEGP